MLGLPVMIDMAENYPAMLAALWESRRQQPLDLVVRNPRFARIVERYAVARATRVLVVIDEAAEHLRALGVPEQRIDVVSNTPPLARLSHPRAQAKPPGAAIEIVYLGFLEAPRGISEAIEAVAQLRRAGVAVSLHLIGDGRDAPLFRAQAERLGVAGEGVRFHGRVPHRAALQLVGRADIGIVPHRRGEYWDTTISNKLFDYMAAGLPVVTSDAAPSARIVRDTGCGEVYCSGDVESLVAAIHRLLDPGIRTRLGECGREAVRQRFHWERDAAVLVRALKRVAEEGRHVRAS
jgi:glycosyltransferase involved in cell wall biosynthesis